MLGGESLKLSGDILNNVTQISEGLNQSLDINLKSVLINGKIAQESKEYSISCALFWRSQLALTTAVG